MPLTYISLLAYMNALLFVFAHTTLQGEDQHLGSRVLSVAVSAMHPCFLRAESGWQVHAEWGGG